MQVIGADDGVEATGAWAEARAKFEWMTPLKIRDAERRLAVQNPESTMPFRSLSLEDIRLDGWSRMKQPNKLLRREMVQRELVQILTPSTVTDGNIRLEAVHLQALKEELEEATSVIPGKAMGLAFVYAAAGRFYVGSLSDDNSLINLRTLLTQVCSSGLLISHEAKYGLEWMLSGMPRESLRALRRSSSPGFLPVTLTPLKPQEELMEAGDAIRTFRSKGFFKDAVDGDWCTKGPTALKMAADNFLAIGPLEHLYHT